jgi:hypothetical protein
MNANMMRPIAVAGVHSVRPSRGHRLVSAVALSTAAVL